MKSSRSGRSKKLGGKGASSRLSAARAAHGATDPELRAEERQARMAAMVQGAQAAPRAGATYSGRTTAPEPKNPADRNQAMRDLAMGEHCQIRYQPVCRHPLTDYTVGCHTNTQADQKGLAYKGHDSAIFFGCDRCHQAIDRRIMTPIETEEVIRAAQERTRIRLRVIAGSFTERPWRVRAALWALEQLAARAKEHTGPGATVDGANGQDGEHVG